VAADRDHTLALWATAKDGWYNFRKREKAPLAVVSAYKSGGVHGVAAAPGGGADRTTQFVTYGAAHVKFWQSDRFSPAVEGRRGCFGSHGAPRVVVSVAFMARDRLVVGGSDGEVFFFEGPTAVRRVQPHSLPVAVLLPLADAVLAVCSNGTCSLVRSEGSHQVASRERPVEIDIASLPGMPDSRLQTPILGGATWRRSSVLLASRTYLLCLDVGGGLHQPSSCSVVLMQPSKPLATACAHPTEPRIFTGALDGGVRCYRSDTHRPLPERSFRAPCGVTCLAVSGCAPGAGASAWLAVGCEDSTLSIMGEASFRYVLRRCLSTSKAKLTCARFSACDASGVHPLWLAVGSADGCIHTFRFKQPFCESSAHSGAEAVEKVATLRGHEASVVDISFADTLPCCYLLSVDASGQSLAWDVPMSRRQPSVGVVRDAPFSPWTAPVGWPVLGCWEAKRSGEAMPLRYFCEVPGRGLIAASDVDTPSIELFPFPCPRPPERPVPRLRGPAVPVTSMLHHDYSDCLLATSDTILFAWSWSHEGVARTFTAEPSPLRSLQGSVLFETPDGSKRALSAKALSAAAFTPPPRSARPGRRAGRLFKENVEAGVAMKPPPSETGFEKPLPSPPLSKSTAQASPAPPAASSAFWTPEPQRPSQGSPGEADAAAFPDVAPLPNDGSAGRCAETFTAGFDGIQRDAPWTLRSPSGGLLLSEQAQVGGVQSDRPRRSQSLVSQKVGAGEGRGLHQMVHSTQRIRDDNAARARSIHQRQQFDSVGFLLGGQQQQGPATTMLVVPQGVYREASAGRFMCRSRDGGAQCEVEVQLPGGRLLRVLRNPLRRTLTFEGEVVSQWAFNGHAPEITEERRVCERLVVQLPPTCDLSVGPKRVERRFDEGRCLVVVEHVGRVAGAASAGLPGAQVGAGLGVVLGRGFGNVQAECEI